MTNFSYHFYLYDASKNGRAFMTSFKDGNETFIITTDRMHFIK